MSVGLVPTQISCLVFRTVFFLAGFLLATVLTTMFVSCCKALSMSHWRVL